MKLTLDWNCVIEVEEGQPQADAVNTLIAAHRKGQIEVALLAASASENTKSKVFPGNAELFLKRVAHLGWQDLPLVQMAQHMVRCDVRLHTYLRKARCVRDKQHARFSETSYSLGHFGDAMHRYPERSREAVGQPPTTSAPVGQGSSQARLLPRTKTVTNP